MHTSKVEIKSNVDILTQIYSTLIDLYIVALQPFSTDGKLQLLGLKA